MPETIHIENYLDGFSGSGGFTESLLQAGFTFTNHYFSEIDKYAIANYKYKYPSAIYAGPIESVLESVADLDLFTFGSPCQGFSNAGDGAGIQHDGSGLIRQAIQIVAERKPGVFIWENVKGLISKKHRKDFWAVIQEFARIGEYRLEWQLLNTEWWLPQNRERMFLIGHHRKERTREIFPLQSRPGADKKENVLYPYDNTTAGTLNTKNNSGQLSIDKGTVLIINTQPRSGDPKKGGTGFLANENHAYCLDTACNQILVVNDNGTLPQSPIVNTLDANYAKGMDNHSQRTMVLCEEYERGKSQGARIYEPIVSTTISSSGGGLGAKTGLYKIGERVRRLTPTECERLQGYPPDFTKYGINDKGETFELSDTQRYKLCGNGISIPPVKEIALKLKEQW